MFLFKQEFAAAPNSRQTHPQISCNLYSPQNASVMHRGCHRTRANEGRQGAKCPGRRATGAPKRTKNLAKTFLNSAHGSNTGAPNLFLAPGSI